MAKYEDYVRRGTRASQPAAASVAIGCLYCVTDEGGIVERSTGAAWQSYGPVAGIGDVIGPASSVASEAVLFDGTSGKLLKRATGTGIVRRTSGVDSVGTVLEGDLGLTDITTGDVTSTKHGFAPKSPADATKFLNGAATSAFALVKDSDLSTSDITTNDVSTSKHGFAPKAPNDATKFLNGANPPAWAVPGGGVVVQRVNTQTGATASGTTRIPIDDTIPQITEGDEYMTLAITPTNASNRLKIDIVAFFSVTAAEWVTQALFKDAVSNALAVFATYGNTANGSQHSGAWSHSMVAGTTSAITFRLRAGSTASGTVRFNGVAGARVYGGVLASSITITELTP